MDAHSRAGRAEQVDNLRGLLGELIPVNDLIHGEVQEPPGLGYRGFVIESLVQDRSFPRRFRVYGSVLTVTDPDKETHYSGAETIERALLDQAQWLGYGELIERFHAS